MKIWSVVCFRWSLNFFLDFNLLHGNEFFVLDFGKEIYVEMERQYLNRIFHYVSSRWLASIWEYYGAGQLETNSSVNYD